MSLLQSLLEQNMDIAAQVNKRACSYVSYIVLSLRLKLLSRPWKESRRSHDLVLS